MFVPYVDMGAGTMIYGCYIIMLWKRLFGHNRFDMPLPILKWVGRHSMTFYVAHYIIFHITFDVIARYSESWYSGWQGIVIITIAYFAIIVPLCFVLDKKKV